MLQIASHQRRIVSQSDGGNEQVGPSDLSQVFDLLQASQLDGSRFVEWRHTQLGKFLLATIQTLLRFDHIFGGRRFQEIFTAGAKFHSWKSMLCRFPCLRIGAGGLRRARDWRHYFGFFFCRCHREYLQRLMSFVRCSGFVVHCPACRRP
jgi:hypothetical protein